MCVGLIALLYCSARLVFAPARADNQEREAATAAELELARERSRTDKIRGAYREEGGGVSSTVLWLLDVVVW